MCDGGWISGEVADRGVSGNDGGGTSLCYCIKKWLNTDKQRTSLFIELNMTFPMTPYMLSDN